MNLVLIDQFVLITGSNRGIGRGIAEGFLNENAAVILTGRNKTKLETTAFELSDKYSKDKVLYFLGDLQPSDTLQSLHEFIMNKVGCLHHLVCNIGSGQSVPPLAEDVTEFQRMLDINLLNAVGVVNHMLPLLVQSTSKNRTSNSIIFVGSICGVDTLGCPVAYASAKSALVSYAKNISRPLGRKGIRVNVVSPGNIMFPGSTWEKKLSENEDKVGAMLNNEVPLQQFGTVRDVANTVVLLASKKAGFVSGAHWVIDGGQTRS